jgi:hypothetical protein
MRSHSWKQVCASAICVGCLFFAPTACAQSTPPWWQHILNKAAKTVAQKAEQTITQSTTAQNSGSAPAGGTGSSTTGTSSQSAAGAPTVSSMSPNVILPFTKQTIIFQGSGFGSVDPFNRSDCFLQFVDITRGNIWVGGGPSPMYFGRGDPYGPGVGSFYVTQWTNTKIVIKRVTGEITNFRPGDLVRVEIANPQNALDYPGHGLCGSPAAKMFVHVASTLPGPRISSFSDDGTQSPVSGSSSTSVSTILPVANQTITISGSGFGEHAPFQGYSRFLQIRDITANNWTSEASCANGCGTGPSVDVTSWTDNQIILSGFLNGYGGADVLNPGDLIRISVANPQLAGDIGSANSVFGGSPPTRMFVTVGNAPQTTQPPTQPTVPPVSNAPLPQASTVFAQVPGYNCNNEAPLSSLPTEVTKIEKLYGRNAAADMVPKIQLESAKEMATGVVEANPPDDPALTQEFESLGRVSDGVSVIGDILGTVQVIQLGGGVYQIVGGELGNAVDKYVRAGYGWGQEFDWCYSTNTEDLNVLPFKVVPVPGESPQFTAAPPTIISVSPVIASATQTITIEGQGLGTHSPYDGDSPYLMISDDTGNWTAGYGLDFVHLNIRSWMSSDIPASSKIVVMGFSGAYGAPLTNWELKPGDRVTIYAWNTDTGRGPAQYSLTVAP